MIIQVFIDKTELIEEIAVEQEEYDIFYSLIKLMIKEVLYSVTKRFSENIKVMKYIK